MEAFELQGRVSAVITDNAANMVKAFALPGMTTFANNDDDDDDQIDHDPLSDDGASAESDPEMLRFVTDNFGCFCHTLQLIVKDALKDAAGINKVIAKLARLVMHVRYSTIASELLEDDYKLVMACAPRWNTLLAMIRYVLKLKPTSLEKLDVAIRPTKYELKISGSGSGAQAYVVTAAQNLNPN